MPVLPSVTINDGFRVVKEQGGTPSVTAMLEEQVTVEAEEVTAMCVEG